MRYTYASVFFHARLIRLVISLPGVLLNDMTCPRYTYSGTQSSVSPSATIGTAVLLQIVMTIVFLAFIMIPSALLTLCCSPSISSSSIPNFVNSTSQTINLMTLCHLFLGHTFIFNTAYKKCPPVGMSAVLGEIGLPTLTPVCNLKVYCASVFSLGITVIDLAQKPGVVICNAVA